jgi:hypothetical protein
MPLTPTSTNNGIVLTKVATAIAFHPQLQAVKPLRELAGLTACTLNASHGGENSGNWHPLDGRKATAK